MYFIQQLLDIAVISPPQRNGVGTGYKAIDYVQMKRDGDFCTLKSRVTTEDGVRKKGYRVTATTNEKQNLVPSCQYDDWAVIVQIRNLKTFAFF